MAIQKNFVIRHGVEVNSNLIFGDIVTDRVGIGTTRPTDTLHVVGGIAGTSINLSGIGTIPLLNGTTLNYNTANVVTGVVTNLTGTNLSYSGISTSGSYYITNTEVISNSRELKNIVSLDAVTTATIESAISNAPNNFTDISVSGISTLGTVVISAGIITATSGIVTYYGDGTYLTGIATVGGGVSFTGVISGDLNVTGITTLGVTSVTNLTANNINVTGILTAGSYYGDGTYLDLSNNQYINSVGIGTSGNINTTGIITASSYYGDGSNLTNISDLSNDISINTSGIITAGFYYGDGSGLTGVGSSVKDDTSTNDIFYPLFTNIISGISTENRVSSTKLTYNPFSGTLTSTDFNSTSDIKLKKNIRTIENSLDTLTQLRGVSFDWKETGKSSYGVIAQELQQVLPELVSVGDIRTVNYNGIIGVLIEAVKELKKEVENLKNNK